MRRAAALYRWSRGGSPWVGLSGDVTLEVGCSVCYLQRHRSSNQELVQKLGDEVVYQGNIKRELGQKSKNWTTKGGTWLSSGIPSARGRGKDSSLPVSGKRKRVASEL